MPSTSSRPSARELLGGRWAISLRGWLIFSVVFALGSLTLRAQLGLPLQAVGLLTLLVWPVTTLLYAGAGLTVFRNRRTAPVHVAWLIMLGVTIAAARAAIAFALPEVRAVVGGGWLGLLTLMLCLVPPMVLVGVLVTYIIALLDWYASERMRLLRFEVDAEAARLRAVGALNAARAVITTRIQTALEDQLSDLERAAKVDGADTRLSDALLDTAAGYVRPESHRLWQERDPTLRRGTIRDVERASLADPLPIALPYALWAIVVLPPAALHFISFRWLLASVILELVAMVVLYPLGRAAVRRYAPAPHSVRARLIALAFMVVAGLTAPAVAVALGIQESPRPLQLVWPLGVVLATILVSWARAVVRTEDARLQSLRSHAEEADFERLALEAATEQMQRELALYLHGTVQAGLVASAYTIQDAVNRGDNQALEAAIADARFAISQVGELDQRADATDLATLAQQHDAKWRGLIAITWRLPSDPIAAEALHRIGNVIQECLANASIHGAASEATVRAVVESDCVIVEVTDDGTGVGDGKPGLGSAVLNEATAGQWTIASVATGGAQVRAVVPN